MTCLVQPNAKTREPLTPNQVAPALTTPGNGVVCSCRSDVCGLDDARWRELAAIEAEPELPAPLGGLEDELYEEELFAPDPPEMPACMLDDPFTDAAIAEYEMAH